ncbi:MAG TPA: hypothetical protein PLL06_15050, partial [Acidobacteriota bacterium]|nr:hypothetical protein [Acidobacteriota bacterium]
MNIPTEWQNAWDQEWLPQLAILENESQKLQFMQCLHIKTSEEDLDVIGESLLTKITTLFAVDRGTAFSLRSRLDSALRIWATSARSNPEITREIAFEKLCLVEDKLVGEHELVPPFPFFETRIPVCNEV